MNISKLLLRFFLTVAFVLCVFAFLGQSTGPLLADGTVPPRPAPDSSVTASATDSASAPEDHSPGLALTTRSKSNSTNASSVRTSPLMQLAACVPQGSYCEKNSDCCQGACTPRGKCGR